MAGDNKAELSELEKQQLLGMDLGDLEDLPEYVTAPSGTYLVLIGKRELKKVGEHPAVSCNFKIQEIIELAQADQATEVKVGDIMGLLFTLDNEYGRGNLKKITKVLGETHGVKSLDDFLKLPEDTVFATITVKRTSQEKNGETKYYNNLVTFLTA